MIELREGTRAGPPGGRYEEVIPLWRTALELGEREFGADDPTTTFLNNLAVPYDNQVRCAAAEL